MAAERVADYCFIQVLQPEIRGCLGDGISYRDGGANITQSFIIDPLYPADTHSGTPHPVQSGIMMGTGRRRGIVSGPNSVTRIDQMDC